MAKISTLNTPLFQSGYIHLDAAGSTASDNTIEGMHLRWDFLDILGDNHLPKEEYSIESPYETASGFNKPDDYVRIYRNAFLDQYHVIWDTSVQPGKVFVEAGVPYWEISLPVVGLTPTVNTVMRIDFTNAVMYNALAASYNVTTQWQIILKKYTGIMEVRCMGKPSFRWEITSTGVDPGNYSMRIEAVGLPNTLEQNEKQLNFRNSYINYTSFHFFSQNTEYVRFDKTNNAILQIKATTYEDYIIGVNAENAGSGNWEPQGKFGLTLRDETMQERLIPAIDSVWPKFSITNVPGEFSVNVDSYLERWSRSGYMFNSEDESENDTDGLQHFIHTYLKESVNDPSAVVSWPSDDPEDPTVQTMSCLHMLRLMSLDFHVARTLGLGHIDQDVEEDKDYVYCMQYLTKQGLRAPNSGSMDCSHIFMTLPLSNFDSRLPFTPSLSNVTFGSEIDNATGQPAVLTDANGYAAQENLRFVNLNRAPHTYEKPFGTFFNEPQPVDLSLHTQTIGYGLKYKEINETDFRLPDINHDDDFRDYKGIPETTIILENGGPRIFTHLEEEEGSHTYSAYSINWFSRISPLSNAKVVTTAFPKIARLIPPLNYSTQLIQDEDPSESEIEDKTLIFTTTAEQEMLELLSGESDQTLVRATFDWNHIHNNAYPSVNYAEYFFREEDPLVVKGKITEVIDQGDGTVLVKTGSYNMTSVFPAQTIIPAISNADAPRFEGSVFSSGELGYFTELVQNAGNAPWFRIKALKQNQAVAPDPSNQNQFLSQETLTIPQAGDLFFVVENMSDASNWDLKHTQRTYIEKHYTNAAIGLRTSPTHVVKYGIKSVAEDGPDTKVILHENLKIVNLSGATAEYTVRMPILEQAANQLKVSGDWTTDLSGGSTLYIFGSSANDNAYTLSGTATYSSITDVTTIVLSQTIPSPLMTGGFASFKVNREITTYNLTNNSITLSGLLAGEIDLAHMEFRTESDGTQTRFVVGGITAPVTFEPLLNDDGSGSGYVQVFMDHDLVPHPDTRISWAKGTIRLKTVQSEMQSYPVTYIGNLTSTVSDNLALVIQDPGFVPESYPGEGDFYTIDLNGTDSKGNYHPSYKLYLPYSNGNHPVSGAPVGIGGVHFNKAAILPVLNDPSTGNKKTFMSVRSADVIENVYSFLSPPSTLLAQKITIPLPPGLPQGPLYATRPDFYGKSTYTFDTLVNTSGGRIPYATIFLKSTNDKLLDVLYTKQTQAAIKASWELVSDELKFDPQLWQILLQGSTDSIVPGNFAIYETTAGLFQWPLPDNEGFYIPFETNVPLSTLDNPSLFKPFKDSVSFALDGSFEVYGRTMTGLEILKRAIADCFIPLTEQPPVFVNFRTGYQTSGAASVIRDTNGNLLDPQVSDIYPMIRKFTEDGMTYVRFTDYSLDGASNSMYFYRAIEMDDKFKFSQPGDTLGPVVMVNSYAPEKPQIRKVLTREENPVEEVPAGIVFELNPYNNNENISGVEIYRSFDETDSLSTRTMTKVKTIAWGDPVEDDFADDQFPLFGEKLFYRLVAIRKVKDIRDVLGTSEAEIVDIPSHPSDIATAGLIDVINPIAPDLEFLIGGVTADEYLDVVISWQTTCYNGTYSLQKMNDYGNWTEIAKIKQKSGTIHYPPLVNGEFDFVNFTATTTFPRKDDNDQPVFHRFRVQVENSSGLFNLEEKAFILQEYNLVQEDYGNIDLEDNTGSLLV